MVRETNRLILRPWSDSDLEPFSALNADPEVMRFFPATLSRTESDAVVGRIRRHFDEHGFGFWALEEKSSGRFLGFAGLSIPSFTAHFMPCVEIGWRLAREHWGKGYATEAARESLRFGFENLQIKEIVSFTAEMNLPSMRVMERIGMVRRNNEAFDHPSLAEGHRLRRHVLYRITR